MLEKLEQLARILRLRIIETSHRAGVPHLGSCLSCVDILTALYFSVLHIDPEQPQAVERDRFILSKGHGAPALFQVLALRGFYAENLLDHYGEDGGIFAEHPPAPYQLPGIEAATGSLGHGLPLGLGMALAARIHRRNYRVFVVLGDGECNEGSIWEAALLAAAQKVSNLCIIVDFNKWQATDRSREVMAIDPLRDKWQAFGWNAYETDGNHMPSLLETLKHFPAENSKPTAIIAHTVKGKGVSFMEDNNNWHYRIPSIDELAAARAELMSEVEAA
ncbi:MAG TPA: transketolase [Gammaproteobacteria bacterium]|nr:transketolase [Gammaproteobacteria bacterium]